MINDKNMRNDFRRAQRDAKRQEIQLGIAMQRTKACMESHAPGFTLLPTKFYDKQEFDQISVYRPPILDCARLRHNPIHVASDIDLSGIDELVITVLMDRKPLSNEEKREVQSELYQYWQKALESPTEDNPFKMAGCTVARHRVHVWLYNADRQVVCELRFMAYEGDDRYQDDWLDDPVYKFPAGVGMTAV